ncbi:MAG: CaiB/BaiF CoA transferase family protein, partial [Candidatus Puniceispirillaceae bacterium]
MSAITGMDDLEGLLVISLEQAVAAPYAAGRLADAGARVIKVERPEGDFARGYDQDAKGHSSYFVWLNRGKESVALNLKQADDLQILKNMISKADIFIQNLMPGALERLGLATADLRAADPRLITCDISGYGSEGPFQQMKAYDFLVQAEVGLAEITGAPEQPGRVGVSICDIAAGMTAHQAILQALYARSRTGQGRGIEVSLFHALADWMNVPYIQSHYGGREIRRPGLHHPTISPYGAYRCGDGRQILLSIQNEREWQRLCGDVLGQPDLPENPKFSSNVNRVMHRADLDAILNTVFSAHSVDDMAVKLQKAQIAFGRLNGM